MASKQGSPLDSAFSTGILDVAAVPAIELRQVSESEHSRDGNMSLVRLSGGKLREVRAAIGGEGPSRFVI